MSYFPFFIDLEQKKGLIAGGGVTALRKIQKLLPYGPQLTVVSPAFHPEIEAFPALTLLRQPFDPAFLEGQFFAIAATDNPQLNHSISELCQQKGILVNVVDSRAECTFLFPALVKRGELTAGISTGGASPSAAIWLKEQLGALVPDNMEQILHYLEKQRRAVRTMFAEEAQRGAVLRALFLDCMERRRPLSEGETAALLNRFMEEESR